MEHRDLRPLIERAVDDFKVRGKPLSLPETARAMVRELLLSMWGFGIEPTSLGGQLWKFGWGTLPVSHEIGGRR